jgi:hypothetical protein
MTPFEFGVKLAAAPYWAEAGPNEPSPGLPIRQGVDRYGGQTATPFDHAIHDALRPNMHFRTGGPARAPMSQLGNRDAQDFARDTATLNKFQNTKLQKPFFGSPAYQALVNKYKAQIGTPAK